MTEHMNAEAVLRNARTTLEKPEAWTRGVMARFDNGLECNPKSEFAVCFCPLGAIARTDTYGITKGVAIQRIEKVLGISGSGSIASWNDEPDRTHDEVLAAFDRAIADA